MTIVVRPADLSADRTRLIEFLARHLTPLSDARRFDWLYTENPHGPAHVWVATDATQARWSALPQPFPGDSMSKEWKIRGCVLGDFCIHPRCRSPGQALQLQGEAMTAANTVSDRIGDFIL